jgi:gluconolactonase
MGWGPEIGDWWMSNQTMNRVLEFAGYDVRHIWGAGTHNENHAASVFPDAMRWLWGDWPTAVSKGQPGNPLLKAILLTGEDWKVAADGCANASHLASNPQGQVFYGAESPLIPDATQVQCAKEVIDGAFAFGAGGGLYVTHAQGGVEVAHPNAAKGIASSRAPGLRVRELTVRNNGDAYVITVPHEGRNELWLLPAKGEPVCQDRDLKGASGLAVSPDGLWLFVAQGLSRSGVSYRINADGKLAAREDFYDFFIPHWADDSGASQVAMDRDGRAYVGTRAGIQVFDRNGRVTAILPLPDNEPVTGICFGGPNFDELFVSAGNKIYKRRVKVPGALPWAAPIKLPPWNAG